MTEFVFMLTHDDATVADAYDVLSELTGSGLRYVGFKDIGASEETLRTVAGLAHEAGMEVMLEIVTTDRDEELRSLRNAAAIGVDWVLGGTQPDLGVEVLRDAGVAYCPFPGTIEGHPSVLRGSMPEIVDHARRLSDTDGVDGVDLLAYRHETVDPIALTRAVVEVVDGPVIVAGSVATLRQIADVRDAGAWGFTIGGAIFDGVLPGGASVPGQVAAVLAALEGTAEAV
jgi:hypothetical protein